MPRRTTRRHHRNLVRLRGSRALLSPTWLRCHRPRHQEAPRAGHDQQAHREAHQRLDRVTHSARDLAWHSMQQLELGTTRTYWATWRTPPLRRVHLRPPRGSTAPQRRREDPAGQLHHEGVREHHPPMFFARGARCAREPVRFSSFSRSPFSEARPRRNFNEHVLDFCQFGSAHRKRTRLWSWHCGHDAALAQTCLGFNGLCTRTHRPHDILEGCIPGTKILRTAAAEPYPDRFVAKAAALLARALDSLELYKLHRCVI